MAEHYSLTIVYSKLMFLDKRKLKSMKLLMDLVEPLPARPPAKKPRKKAPA